MKLKKILIAWIVLAFLFFKFSYSTFYHENIVHLSYVVQKESQLHFLNCQKQIKAFKGQINCILKRQDHIQLLTYTVESPTDKTNRFLNKTFHNKQLALHSYKSINRFTLVGKVIAFIIFLLPIFLLWFKYSRPKELSLRNLTLIDISKHVFLTYLSLITINYLILFIFNAIGHEISNNPQSLKLPLQSNFLSTFVLIVLIAPIVEEMFFRGLLFRFFIQKGKVLIGYLLINSEFTAAHYYIFQLNTNEPTKLFSLITIFALSTALCWIYKKTNTIFSPIALHMLNNLVGVIILVYN